MAGEGTKRIIDLSEAAETQSGDYIASVTYVRDLNIAINNLIGG